MYLQDTTEEQGYVARMCYKNQDTHEFEQVWTEALALASEWDFFLNRRMKNQDVISYLGSYVKVQVLKKKKS